MRGDDFIARLTFVVLFMLPLRAEAASTAVPPQLYGKSVTHTLTGIETFVNEATNKVVTNNWERTDSLYFSSEGRVFARFAYRNQWGSYTCEQVGASNAIGATSATGGAARMTSVHGGNGTGACRFQDIHFEGHSLVAIQKRGNNSAIQTTVDFDDTFHSCAFRLRAGTDDGKAFNRIGWSGQVQRVTSNRVTSNSGCMIRDGNIFGN